MTCLAAERIHSGVARFGVDLCSEARRSGMWSQSSSLGLFPSKLGPFA